MEVILYPPKAGRSILKFLILLTAMALIISSVYDKNKTLKALKIAFFQFSKILPALLTMIVIVSIGLYFLSDTVIIQCLSKNNIYIASLIASAVGSLTMMPGFIAFPLCGILLNKGIPYTVLSAFASTLMMVGIVTYPIERVYFSARVTIVRNLMSCIIAIIVAIVTGIFYGELF